MFSTITSWVIALGKMPHRVADTMESVSTCKHEIEDLHTAIHETQNLIHEEIRDLRVELKGEINALEMKVEKLQGDVVMKETCVACRNGINHVVALLMNRETARKSCPWNAPSHTDIPPTL